MKHGPRDDFGAEISTYLEAIEDEELQALAVEMSELVQSAAPKAAASIKWGIPFWDSDGPMCAVSVHGKGAKAYVKLQMMKGTSVDDPDGLLEGTGKDLRHVKIPLGSKAPKTALKKMIKQAVKVNKDES